MESIEEIEAKIKYEKKKLSLLIDIGELRKMESDLKKRRIELGIYDNPLAEKREQTARKENPIIEAIRKMDRKDIIKWLQIILYGFVGYIIIRAIWGLIF